MVKHPIQLILICIVLLAASMAKAETLRIVTLNLPPYGYVENGVNAGFNYELGNLIATEAGLEPENHILPLARTINEIAAGRADIVIMFPSPKINNVAKNIGSIHEFEIIILGRADSKHRSIADLRGKTIATVRCAQYDARISKKNGFILYPTKDYTQSLKMLLAKRVDATIGPKMGLFFAAKKNNYPKQAFSTPLVLSATKGCVFISNKTSPSIAKKVTEAVNVLLKKNDFKSLLEKYSL